jgi:flagellin
MARINTNVPSLVARSVLARNNSELELRLQRLSTGLRINRGADDPAGLITSERLRSEIRGVDQGIKNADRASAVIATTEGALAEVSELLNSIKALVVESASTGAQSQAERDANQLQIDSAIDSITRISNTASFGGLKLLNGSMDYTLSGLKTSAIAAANVYSASFVASDKLKVDVDVLNSAQVGSLFINGNYVAPNSAMSGRILSTTTLRITGSRGVAEITVVKSATMSDLVKAVNDLTSLTGVKAQLNDPTASTNGIVFETIDYGSKNFVSVDRLGGPTDNSSYFKTYKVANNANYPVLSPVNFTTLIGNGTLTLSNRDEGRDVNALINGTLATGDGLEVQANSPALSLKLILTEAFATNPSSAASSFHITGGGAMFQLGPQVTAQQQSNIAVQSIAASNLGGTQINGTIEYLSSLKSGQANSLNASNARKNFTPTTDILESAIDETSVLRGRLGAFERNVLETNVRSLQAAFENLNASDSIIRDADFAAETSQLTRAQILVQSGTTILGLANQQSQQVLQLLG